MAYKHSGLSTQKPNMIRRLGVLSRRRKMRRALLTILSMFALPLSAQTADEIVSKYVKTIGGMDKIAAVRSFRRSGKYTGGGGFEARVLEEKKRPDLIRQEFSIQ